MSPSNSQLYPTTQYGLDKIIYIPINPVETRNLSQRCRRVSRRRRLVSPVLQEGFPTEATGEPEGRRVSTRPKFSPKTRHSTVLPQN